MALEQSTFPFCDIILKLEKNEKVSGRIDEVWRKISNNRYECKIAGKILDKIQFFRYVDSIGGHKFIIEL